MNIAQTIVNQIKALTPTSVLWSWGASKWQALGESSEKTKSVQGIGEDYLGGVMFYVRGMNHKGHVIVSLALNDTYTVTIGSVRKGTINPKKQVREVYFDELSEVIDNLVEKQDNYVF